MVQFCCRAGIGEGGMFRRGRHLRKNLEHNLSNLLGPLERMLDVFGVCKLEVEEIHGGKAHTHVDVETLRIPI